MSNEIAVYNRMADPISAMEKMGTWIAKSGMIKCRNEQAGQVLALVCLCENISPIEVIRKYHLTDDGQLSKKTMAAYAEFRGKGGKVKWLDIGETPNQDRSKWQAKAEITWDGQTVTMGYSMADADRQQLIRKGGNWEKTPGKMLRARLLSNAIGMLAPEIYAGDSDDNDPLSGPVPELLKAPGTNNPIPEKQVTPAAPVAQKPSEAAPAAPSANEPITLEFKAEVLPAPAPTGGLPVEKVQALEAAIGVENAEIALKWLTVRGWIKTGLHEMSEQRADRILARPAEFIKTVKGGGV